MPSQSDSVTAWQRCAKIGRRWEKFTPPRLPAVVGIILSCKWVAKITLICQCHAEHFPCRAREKSSHQLLLWEETGSTSEPGTGNDRREQRHQAAESVGRQHEPSSTLIYGSSFHLFKVMWLWEVTGSRNHCLSCWHSLPLRQGDDD